jgi:phosphoribosyl 1,2-cyclic phosphodiesterase
MLLKVTGSSSRGNNYILEGKDETLLIDCGIPLLEVKKALNFDLSKIVGCLCDHEHGDHSKFITQYLNAGIQVYLSPETAKAKGLHRNMVLIETGKIYKIGTFQVKAFDLVHDCRNYGFLIRHSECGDVIFITDTNYCRYKFPGLNQVLIECNYSEKIVDEKLLKGTANMFVRNRVLESHMEFETTKDFLKANDLSKVNNIVLIHLSESNSNESQFQRQIQELTGKSVYIAKPGLVIDFNKQSF